MFKHIVVDAKKIAHQARYLTKTKEAHKWILQLSRPLADITDLINENISALNRHYNVLENLTKEDIEEQLFVPKICLQVNELKKPMTVCTSTQCCEYYSENNKKQHFYKRKCHDPCFLNNIPQDIIGSPELMYCAAMNAQYYCKKCSCHFSKHMHVLYLTRKVEHQIRGTEEMGKLNHLTVTDVRQKVALFLEKIRGIEEEYKSEGEKIVKIMAKFSHFEQQHGFSSGNDAYEKYLLYLISREVRYGPEADMSLIKHYKAMLNDYKEEKSNLDAFLTSKKGDNCAVSAEEILTSVDKLFQLILTGQQLKDLHDVQLKCTTWNEKQKSSAGTSNKESKKVTILEP